MEILNACYCEPKIMWYGEFSPLVPPLFDCWGLDAQQRMFKLCMENNLTIFIKLVDILGVIFWNGTSMDVKLTIDLKLSSYMEDSKFIINPFIFIIFTSKDDKVQIFTSVRNKLKNEEIWSGLQGDINNLHSIESNGSRMYESCIKDGKLYWKMVKSFQKVSTYGEFIF